MRYEPVDPQTAQALDAAAQCRRSMQTASVKDADDPLGTIVSLEMLIASYPEGRIPGDESVFQFEALPGETVCATYGGGWVEADTGPGQEIGVVTDGPYGGVFWNLTGKRRERLHRPGEQGSLIFYWKTTDKQLATP